MTEQQAIKATMDCAKQIVQSYGPITLSQRDRDNLCAAMDHYAVAAVAALTPDKRMEE